MSTTQLLNPATTEALMPAFEAFIAELIAKFHPRKVIWFGSRARGEGDGWSDFDVLVLMDRCDAPLRMAGQMACELDPDFSVDLVVRDSAAVAERLAMGDGFLQEVFLEGIQLYESPAT